MPTYSHLTPLQEALTGLRGAGAATLAPGTPAEHPLTGPRGACAATLAPGTLAEVQRQDSGVCVSTNAHLPPLRGILTEDCQDNLVDGRLPARTRDYPSRNSTHMTRHAIPETVPAPTSDHRRWGAHRKSHGCLDILAGAICTAPRRVHTDRRVRTGHGARARRSAVLVRSDVLAVRGHRSWSGAPPLVGSTRTCDVKCSATHSSYSSDSTTMSRVMSSTVLAPHMPMVSASSLCSWCR